jgi:hypothetical protein
MNVGHSAAFAQLATSRWNAATEGNSLWDDAMISQRPRQRITQHVSAALDSVMEDRDSWLFV